MKLQDIDISELLDFINSTDLYFVNNSYPFFISKLDKDQLPINLRVTCRGIEWFDDSSFNTDTSTKRYPLFNNIKEARLYQHKERVHYLQKELSKEEKEFNKDKDLLD